MAKPEIIKKLFFSKAQLIAFILTFACVGGYFILSSLAAGANHYVRAGATGNGSGSDWANACTDFTGSCAVASLARGDTYYVAAGTYGSRTFNTAASGTLTITIKGATDADHGSDTGWLTTYGVGTAGRQAKFAYNLRFDNAQYFIFDGNTACGSGSPTAPACSDPTTYGFTVNQPGSCGDQEYVYYQTGTVNNDTWAHIALTACGGTSLDVGRVGFSDDFAQASLSNLTFSHNYCSYFEGCIEARKTSGGTTATNITIEYLYDTNGWSSASHHGEQINLVDHVDGVTIRYSIFAGYAVADGTATIAANDAAPVQPCVNNANIYGNVFAGGQGGNGAIASTAACSFNNTHVYNNTFAANVGPWWASSSATGNVLQNNVIYNQLGAVSNATHDYNSYFSTTSPPSEAHGQVSSGNPFVNAAGGNYHLAADTSVWNPIGIPGGDGIDPDGVSRTSSRGAYQFSSGGGSDTTAPTVSMTAPSDGATVSASTTVSATASDDVGVVGVQFKLDGANLSTEDTSSPYSISWNTTSASNGTHTLTAIARDAAGNTTTSTSVSVTVNNAVGPIPGDLNNDSHVTILDLSILLSHYGQAASASQGDINTDGTCNILDLSILLSHYGT